MNLDKLKELEAKATQGEWEYIGGDMRDEEDGVYLLVSGNESSVDMTQEDKDFVLEFRNSAKEMISTIERYKAALEVAGEAVRYIGWERDLDHVEKVHKDIVAALKDPEKALAE